MWALPVTSAAVSAGGAALTFATAGTSDAVTGTPAATSAPVNALNAAHADGVTVTVAQLQGFDSNRDSNGETPPNCRHPYSPQVRLYL